MSKTGWTLTAATVLVVLSVVVWVTRRSLLGADVEGAPGWRVTIVVKGEVKKEVQSVRLPLPPEFRRQHISDESFDSAQLNKVLPKRRQRARQITWRREGSVIQPLPFEMTYTFHVQTGLRLPTAAMNQGSRRLDRTTPNDELLKPTKLIQSGNKAIQMKAQELAPRNAAPEETVQALFEFVDGLGAGDKRGALGTLQKEGGSAEGKARLLIALCRSRGIHARLLTGLVLTGEGKQPLHSWAEAWVRNHWVPMDPTDHHFGDAFPETYLVLHIGKGGFRPSDTDKVEVECQLERPRRAADPTLFGSALRTYFQKTSLYELRPAEQHLARFLLLLPLAALLVSVYRTIIGVPTFGTFSPALLGLAFLDLRALRWGLPIFVFIILVGWLMRHGLERFHLLQVPRAAALLTLIVGLLIALIMVAHRYGVTGTQYISLFPLVILTHLVERFWTIEAEDGTMSSFKTLVGTMVVAITVSLALAPDAVGTWVFRYPETLLAVLAVQLALGRYTGYRLSELYRFADMIDEDGTEYGVRSSEAEKREERKGVSNPAETESPRENNGSDGVS